MMARVKRKSGLRGLGFAPEKHQEEAARYAALAADSFDRSARVAKEKQCSLALETYAFGRQMVGAAMSESWAASGGKRRMTGDDWPEWDKAIAAVKTHCIVRGSGVSGLGRKPARRTRKTRR